MSRGLGLHLIRDLAKSIGWKISVKSELGAGMEFQLTVPDLSEREYPEP